MLLIPDSPPTTLSVLTAARAWFKYLILGAIVGAIVAAAATLAMPPDYLAKAQLLVTPSDITKGLDFSTLEATQALTPTLSELATTTPVLRRVILDVNPNLDPVRLEAAVTTRVPTGTSIIEISVADKDATQAAALANAFANELVNYQARSGNPDNSALQVTLTVVDPATPPKIRNGPGIVITTILGGAIGVFLEFGVLYFVDFIRRSRDDKRNTIQPTFGAGTLR